MEPEVVDAGGVGDSAQNWTFICSTNMDLASTLCHLDLGSKQKGDSQTMTIDTGNKYITQFLGDSLRMVEMPYS